MAHDADMCEDDAEVLRVRRADLMLPQPETYLEAERAVRAIAAADRLTQAFDLTKADVDAKTDKPAAPSSVRIALRSLADRMLTQLYTAPKPKPAPQPVRPVEEDNPAKRRLHLQQIERELWEQFTAKGRAWRAAQNLKAQSASEAEAPKQPNLDNNAIEPPIDETTALNSRPETSGGQDDKESGQTPNPP